MDLPKIAINILYVDDEPNNIIIFEMLFKRNYNVHTASSAEEGIKIIQTYPIHIVVTDERMPEITGTEFLQMVSELNPDIIRFVLTAYTDNTTILEAVNTGHANAFFTKPIDYEEINSTIKEYEELITLRAYNENLLKNLKRMNEIETLLRSISHKLVKAPYENLDNAIVETLATLCDFIVASGASILQLTTSNNYLESIYTYLGKGVKKPIIPSEINAETIYQYWWNSHMTNTILCISNIRELKDLAFNEYQVLQKNGIKSTISVPIITNNSFSGCLILFSHNERKSWTPDDLNYLNLVGEILSSIIEKKISNEAVIEYQNKLQQLNKELTLAEEQERRRIAVNLHDHISQSLAMSKIQLSGIIAQNQNSPLLKELNSVQNLINESIDNSRKLTYDLSPPVLYELGLDAAIRWKMEQVEKKHDIKTKLTFNNINNRRPTKETEVLLFRIISELTNNCLKHADADLLDITLNYFDDSLEILFVDNGKGFDQEHQEKNAESDNKFGLFSIKERLNYLQGKIDIKSKPSMGTKVHVTVPSNFNQNDENLNC